LREVLEVLSEVDAHLRSEPLAKAVQELEGESGLQLVVELAHDLRSPLGSILSLCDTLRQGRSGEVNELQKEQLGLAYSAALALVAVSNDVMDLARSGRGRVLEDPEAFSVTEVFTSVQELLAPMAEQKKVDLRLDIQVPDQLVGHPAAIGRVLGNLVTNALKFTETGFVRVSAEGVGEDEVEFAVRDTGRGISEGALASLFDMFRVGHGYRGIFFSRSGLGLAITRRLVREMGSELRFETREGWGTRFYFVLPLRTHRVGEDGPARD
jgi:signal transduction histidine kinase